MADRATYMTIARDPGERTTLVVYDPDRPLSYAYESCCQIVKKGRVGLVDTLIGTGVYRVFAEYGWQPFENMGIDELRADVTEGHAKLIRTRMAGKLRVDTLGKTIIGDVHLLRVSIKPI